VFNSRGAPIRTLASTKMRRSTLIRTRMKTMNLEMMSNKKDIMEDLKVITNMLTRSS